MEHTSHVRLGFALSAQRSAEQHHRTPRACDLLTGHRRVGGDRD
eukprot:gene34105-5557_t